MKKYLVFYSGVDYKQGPMIIEGPDIQEPSYAARHFFDYCMNKNVSSHVGDKLYVVPDSEVIRYTVKGLLSLERD